jgi:hypothetical protein
VSIQWVVRANTIVGWVEAPDARTAYTRAVSKFETDETEVTGVQAVVSADISKEERAALERNKRLRVRDSDEPLDNDDEDDGA